MKGLFWKEPLPILKGPVVFVFSSYYEVPFVGENCLPDGPLADQRALIPWGTVTEEQLVVLVKWFVQPAVE